MILALLAVLGVDLIVIARCCWPAYWPAPVGPLLWGPIALDQEFRRGTYCPGERTAGRLAGQGSSPRSTPRVEGRSQACRTG
jgi:hypothetical protein